MGSQSSCTWQKKAAVPYWVVPELRHVPSLHCRAPAHEHVCWLGTVVLSNKECPYFVCECWLDCYVRTMYIIPFHDDVLNTTTRMCTSGHLLLSGKHNCIHIRTNTYFLMGSVLIHVRSMLSHLRGWFSSHECWTACLAISFCHFSALAWLTSQNRLMSFISIRWLFRLPVSVPLGPGIGTRNLEFRILTRNRNLEARIRNLDFWILT